MDLTKPGARTLTISPDFHPEAPGCAPRVDPHLPVYSRLGFVPVRGQGVFLTAQGGRELLDLYGGHAVALLGYAHPRLLAALEEAAKQLFFASNAVELEVRTRAAEKLASFAPEGLTRIFFVNSGAEANENALRLAFKRTSRTAVLALEDGFHGRTAAAGAVTASSFSWYGFPRSPFPVRFLSHDVDSLERALSPSVAALIVEPVQGIAGAKPLGREYLIRARELTERNGTMLIFDEVQCGMGRTGHPFAAQLYGVTPDILTTAKGLAGGFPAGAVLVTDDVASCVRMGDLGTTFGGGPLACALMEAVIDTILEDKLLDNVRRISRLIRETCQVGPVRRICGEGFLLGLDVGSSAKRVQSELLDRGIVVGGSNDPNVLRLLPPLILEAPHVARLARALQEIA
jgi:acetylornithine/succinyldiaminopimelate/putrescine aminotransferase